MGERRLTIGDARNLTRQVLMVAGAAERVADSVAQALVLAECDGQSGHGLSRLIAYADQVASGKVDGQAVPEVFNPRPATLLVDACHGFAFPAIDAAVPRLAHLASRQGVAAAAFARSHHFGVAGHPVEQLARRGLVALAFSNAPAAIAPWGGTKPVFGTNPIAFAAPRESADPVVIDLSLSKVARGKVNVAAQRGQPIPDDWAIDADGHPTTDAKAALAGSMRPAGDAKGAALAFMVEVLSAALSGANFGFEASSFFHADGAPPGVGHLLLAIDPGGFGKRDFAYRLETLLEAITGQEGARLPGQKRFETRASARAHGLVLDPALVNQLRERIGAPK